MATKPSLDEVLVMMGLATQDQLSLMRDMLTASSREETFGKVLVAHNVITMGDLSDALELLSALSGEDKVRRAEAAFTVVQKQSDAVTDLASKLRAKAQSVKAFSNQAKRETGDRYPAVGKT